MEQLKIFLKLKQVTLSLFGLWLLSIFLPVRKIFIGRLSYFAGEYSDFLTFSLYLSQILVLVLFIALFLRSRELPILSKSSKAMFSLIFLSIILNFRSSASLSSAAIFTWAICLVSYATIATLNLRFDNFPKKTAFLIAIFALFEGIIGISQFLLQESLGLKGLGEPVLTGSMYGVAKIVSGGTFIRAYGTFPHPNLLAVFMLVAIALNIWLILNEKSQNLRLFYYLSLITSTFALLLTFSRAAWLAALMSFAVVWFGYLSKFNQKKQLFRAIFPLLLALLVGFTLFKPLILARATSAGESFSLRKTYNQTGLSMIREKPILGFGGGESMLHMQQFSPVKLQPWEIQPIHNYYILSAAELGLPIALLLLAFFLWHVIHALKTAVKETDVQRATWNLTLTALIVAFLILMLFDHYFYTLMQTQALLWIILGLIFGETLKNKSLLHMEHHKSWQTANSSYN